MKKARAGCRNDIQATGDFPQGLKPQSFRDFCGTAKAVPFQRMLVKVGAIVCRTVHAQSARYAISTTLAAVLFLMACPRMPAQKATWRQATDAELASLLPARAPVIKEHIETEMRTASGIVNGRGRFIAGVVLITAGYSADGKYSHYLVVQAPIRIGGIELRPGEYVFGWVRNGEALKVHFNSAATGELVGNTDARLIAGHTRVESLRIWPPGDKELIQIGRFGIPYELKGE